MRLLRSVFFGLLLVITLVSAAGLSDLKADLGPAELVEREDPPLRGVDKRSLKKRCHYVGTFFVRIDCNAPKSGTDVPYGPKAVQTSTAPEPAKS